MAASGCSVVACLTIVSFLGGCEQRTASSGPVSTPVVATQTKSSLDVEALQGIWQIVTVERDGKIVKEAPEGRWKVFIGTGDTTELHWSWQGPDAPAADSIYISDLNSTTTPKAMNVSHGGPGSLAAAIYALNGDRLEICLGKDIGGGILGPRPKTFSTAPKDGRVLYVMKRVQNVSNASADGGGAP